MKKLLWIIPLLLIGAVIVYDLIPHTYHYNMEQSVRYLNKHAERKSKGRCAQYVRLALEAGGCCTWGHPMSAKGYGDFLLKLDFTPVDKEGYRPQKGDIVVFDAVRGHPFGHIAMWNGRQWLSDFRQRGFYVARAYTGSDDYTYFRMTKQQPRRYFTLKQHLMGGCDYPLQFICHRVKHSGLF